MLPNECSIVRSKLCKNMQDLYVCTVFWALFNEFEPKGVLESRPRHAVWHGPAVGHVHVYVCGLVSGHVHSVDFFDLTSNESTIPLHGEESSLLVLILLLVWLLFPEIGFETEWNGCKNWDHVGKLVSRVALVGREVG